ncbi:MAG: hypothetical protein ACHQX3_01000 [Nitrospirales bacterium]|jgi:hypothetical protein
MEFRIKSVDHYGYNGRDLHPSDAMIGEIVTPIQLHVEAYNVEGEWLGTPQQLRVDERVKVMEQAKDGGLVYIWTCVRPNGQLVELVDHEVEAI